MAIECSVDTGVSIGPESKKEDPVTLFRGSCATALATCLVSEILEDGPEMSVY